MSRFVVAFLCLGLTASAWAGEASEAKRLAEQIAPFLDKQTVGVGHVDLSKVDVPKVMKGLQQFLQLQEGELAVDQAVMQKIVNALRGAGVQHIYAVVTMKRLPRDPVFLVVPVAAEDDVQTVVKILREDMRIRATRVLGRVILAGEEEGIAQVQKTQQAPPKELLQGLELVSEFQAQTVFLLPEPLRTALGETMPQLPADLGGGSSKIITEGIRWAAAGASLPPAGKIKFIVQASDADSAKELQQLLEKLVTTTSEKESWDQFIPDLDKFIQKLIPKVKGDQLVLNVEQKDVASFVAPAMAKVRESAAQMQSMNNLKQIGIALHSYHDAHGSLPPQYTASKNGKKLLSWRVHILPYIEQQNLYQQFKLDEPWDSPHNKKLIAQIPSIYRSPNSRAEAGKTTYLVPVYKQDKVSSIFGGPRGIKITEITDGTSVTIFTLEADDEQAVIWTRPDDLEIDPQQPLKGLLKNNRRGFSAGFADGSVRFISAAIDPRTFLSLITRNGGEVIGDIP